MKEIIYKILLAGIDTLEIGYCISEFKLSNEEWDMLYKAKDMARVSVYKKDTGCIKFRGIDFQVIRTGYKFYYFILANDDIQIYLSTAANSGKYVPEVKVIFRSRLLWRNGYEDAVEKMYKWISTWVNAVSAKPSRVDITLDLLGSLPAMSNDLKEVVTRTRAKKEYGKVFMNYERYTEGNKKSGYTFGTKELSCRIYDKTLEIISSNKQWIKSIWGAKGWRDGVPVTRVEFECRRKFLKQMQIESVEDLLLRVADLWRYLVEEWLTIRIVSCDTHHQRWPLCGFWQTVQSAIPYFGEITGVTRLSQMRPQYNRLESQTRGLCISIAALASQSLAAEDIDYGIRFMQLKVNGWLKEPEFREEVEHRMFKHGRFEN